MVRRALYLTVSSYTPTLLACVAILLVNYCNGAARARDSQVALEKIKELFLARTPHEWKQNWHVDCHRRCRSELIHHIRIACEKDIYRLDKRLADSNNPFMGEDEANSFFKVRSRRDLRLKRRGIMQECCYDKPCSWEEFAESCHTHSRLPASRINHCKK
ncbi:unnamed protein product [Owenia fusiformis]|uniref:Uncharacterized protein n=1 Tax=Owenia fusiformis TaxID=6347 RepID=A0A8S4PZ81_OWEFU|nr:unnamed protein product [Owenia fusiformis]